MKGGCLFQVEFFDEMDPCGLGISATSPDQILNQHTMWRDQIWNMRLPGRPRGRPSGPKEYRMEMHHIETGSLAGEGSGERRRPIEPPQDHRWEISDLDTIERDRSTERHRTVARTIDIGGEHFDVVTHRRQRTTEPVHRKDRAAVTGSRKIRRNHV